VPSTAECAPHQPFIGVPSWFQRGPRGLPSQRLSPTCRPWSPSPASFAVQSVTARQSGPSQREALPLPRPAA